VKSLLLLLFIPLQAQEIKTVDAVMTKARNEARIPAIGAVAFNSDEITQYKIVGSTRSDKEIPIEKDAAWHIGSDAKAMTATLMAVLVEKRHLTWETTMAEIFPDLADEFHPEARKTTITQLLGHTAGLPANPEPADRRKSRLAAAKIGLTLKPEESFRYSNFGYIIAGAVIEKLLGTTWEKAIIEHLFEPLGIKSVGFGAPKGSDAIRGHQNGKPVGTGFLGDNPPMYGPAGGLHLSLSDWVLFCQDQIKGHHGKGKLLKKVTYQKLHTPVSENYALGWGVDSKDGKTTILRHDGSNTMWYARAVLDLENQRGQLITLNTADPDAVKWISKIAGALQPRSE
jgi:CubicO group peptidase (beta-lactamase class C family)